MLKEPNSAARERIAILSVYAKSIASFRGDLIKEMVSRGATVHVFAPDFDDQSRREISALGATPVAYTMARAGMNPVRDVIDMVKLARALRALDINVTFAYFIKPVIYGTLAAWLAGVPRRFSMIEGAGYIFTEQAVPSWRRAVMRRAVSVLYRVGLSKAHRVFMLNPDDRALFVGGGMVPAEKVQVINGIGLALQHYQLAAPVSSPLSFILIGRLLREKGIYDYVAAARLMKKRHPDVRFVLLGDVDANPGAISTSEVAAWVNDGVVEWPGQVSDVRPWIAAASVFVLPSYREGLPRSTQEAMALGRPIITTDVPGCRQTVDEGVNGFIVPVRNPEALAQAMMRFVANPALIADMGAASRHLAERRYDVDVVNRTLLSAMGL